MTSVRSSFLEALRQGRTLEARSAAAGLLQADSTIRQLRFIAKSVNNGRANGLQLRHMKVALLSSFTVEFLEEPLIALGFLNGLDIEVYTSGFAQYSQEILDPGSHLYAFEPNVVVLAIEGQDWLPEIYEAYPDQAEVGFDEPIAKSKERMAVLLRTFRKRSSATLLINNFVPPRWPQLGVFDGQFPMGQTRLVRAVNQALRELCNGVPSAYVVDYEALVARFGALNWYDDRMRHYAKAPINQAHLGDLAAEYMKFCRALVGGSKKCLVLDLDNTLWGGVLGEDGITGIQLGPTYPGSAYLALQRAILNLHKRGVILAISSKNDPDDVDEVFRSHPHTLLRREHFAARQINWNRKSESIRALANELSLGLEHMVFLDDSPVECEEVARALPMVTTLCLPKQPESYVAALLNGGWFDSLGVSIEDRSRGELYRQRAQAEALREESESLEEFYRSLEMEAEFTAVGADTLARAVQLTQKTNQFNLTTIRYTEVDVRERIADPDWLVTCVSLRDRFGSNGIVGLMMARLEPNELEIDTFLMSCRVIGRTLETAMLAYLCERALERGRAYVRGRVVPTKKNGPARDVFARHGFKELEAGEDDATVWRLNAQKKRVDGPDWITVTGVAHGQVTNA